MRSLPVLGLSRFELSPWLLWVVERLRKGLWPWLRRKFFPYLTIELPKPVNPMGRVGTGGGFTPSWNVKVRFINRGREPLAILELYVEEEGVGAWRIEEMFLETRGPVLTPFQIEKAFECWIRMSSPRTFPTLPVEVGPLALRVRDHTQQDGRYHTFPLSKERFRYHHTQSLT